MVKLYRKGFRAERELLRILSARGYSCVRSASSGGFLTPVDIVAIKQGKVLCFEIKSWIKKPKPKPKQLERLLKWSENAGALTFIGWYNKNTWLFLPLKNALEREYEDENWISLEEFLRIFV